MMRVEEGDPGLDAVSGRRTVLMPAVVLLDVAILPCDEFRVAAPVISSRSPRQEAVGEEGDVVMTPPRSQVGALAQPALASEPGDRGLEALPSGAAGELGRVAAIELVARLSQQHAPQFRSPHLGEAVQLVLVVLLRAAHRCFEEPQQPLPLLDIGHPVGIEEELVVGQL